LNSGAPCLLGKLYHLNHVSVLSLFFEFVFQIQSRANFAWTGLVILLSVSQVAGIMDVNHQA
jgi:hypothetical protein